MIRRNNKIKSLILGIAVAFAVTSTPSFTFIAKADLVKLEERKYSSNEEIGKKNKVLLDEKTTVKPQLDVKDITLQTIEEVRKSSDNKVHLIEGVVTYNSSAGLYMQDDTAGIVAYKKGGIKANIGDRIKVLGSIGEYHGLKQINPKDDNSIIKVEENVNVSPRSVKSSDINKTLEGQLVEIDNLECLSVDKNGIYNFKDEKGTARIKGVKDKPFTINNSYKAIVGVLTYEYDELRIQPRSSSDIKYDDTVVSGVIASPAKGKVEIGAKVKLTTETKDAIIRYTLDGSDVKASSDKYKEPITIDKAVTIKAKAFKEGLEDSKQYEFTYEVEQAKEGKKISEIQGAAHRSALEGQVVENVRGVVTAIQKDNYTDGFYIQDTKPDNDDKTSEGIYVDKKGQKLDGNVKIGDLVSVTGKVLEAQNGFKGDETGLTITEIKTTAIDIKSSNNELPKPIVIGSSGRKCPSIIDNDNFAKFDPEEDAIDFYESLEGMLVEVKDPLIVGEREDYGETTVLPDNGKGLESVLSDHKGVIAFKDNKNPERIIIDDVIVPITNPKTKRFYDSNFRIKVGDKFEAPIKGIMSYGFGNFKVLNTEKLPKIIDGGLKREVTHINEEKDKLTVATYNIENFSPQAGERIQQVADSIVKNLKAPDIVGLIEIQDNDGEKKSDVVDASETLKTLIEAISKANGPQYGFVQINPINDKDGGAPGSNIRPAFIYRKDRVKLSENKAGDSTTSVEVVGNGEKMSISLNPGRIDPNNTAFENCRKSLTTEFIFNDQKVFVIANHFSSKRGDTGLFSTVQPPKQDSEGIRIEQGKVVNEFMKKLLKANPEANIVCLGDLNDFQYSDTVKALKGDILTNMIDILPKSEQHTYVHEGNSQVLDNILVNNKLSAKTIVDAVNINSEFTEADGRVSDHDPVLIQIDLQK